MLIAKDALRELEKQNTSKELLSYRNLIALYGNTRNVVENDQV